MFRYILYQVTIPYSFISDGKLMKTKNAVIKKSFNHSQTCSHWFNFISVKRIKYK